MENPIGKLIRHKVYFYTNSVCKLIELELVIRCSSGPLGARSTDKEIAVLLFFDEQLTSFLGT